MKKLGEFSVGEVMTLDPIVITETCHATDAIRKFQEQRVSALPVIDDLGRISGIVSVTDILGLTRDLQTDLSALWMADDATSDFIIGMLKDQGGQTLVGEIMTRPVTTIRAQDNLVIAAQQMAQAGFRHLPVVDELHRPVGMLSTTDFVRVFADCGALMAG
jgi:CBS domain-containing protein